MSAPQNQYAYPQSNEVTAPFASGPAVAVNDLVCLSSGNAVPASSLTANGSEAADQAIAAPLFLGVSTKRILSTDTTETTLTVARDWIGLLNCTSATYSVGDKLSFCEKSANAGLENDKVKATANAALAIGHVMKTYASATTTVLCRLVSNIIPPIPTLGTPTGYLQPTTGTLVAAGNAIGNANAVTTNVVTVSGADGTKGVRLPATTASTSTIVVNLEAAQELKVYPATNDKIDGGSANAAITLGNAARVFLVSDGAGNWYSGNTSAV